MTNDELIKLAGDAGFSLGFSGNIYVGNVLVTDYLKSFADLVSAHAITSMQTEQPVTGDSTPDHLPDWSNAKELSESSALEALLLLKRYKDSKGKDAWYSRQQPLVWALAAKARGKSAPSVTSMQGDSDLTDDHKRLVRELDALLNNGVAAKQASLCDLVSQVRKQGITVNNRIKGVSDEKYCIDYEPSYPLTKHIFDVIKRRFELNIKYENADQYDGSYLLEGDLKAIFGQLSTNTDGWVSVDDRLPELVNHEKESLVNGIFMPASKKSERCLVVINGNVTDSRLTWREDYPDRTAWSMLGQGVTHWKPYPNPPVINAISQPKGGIVCL